MADFSRREFLKLGAATCLSMGASGISMGCANEEHDNVLDSGNEKVVVHTILGDGLADLYEMGRRAAEALGIPNGRDMTGRSVFIKPNLSTMGLGHPFDPRLGESTKAEILLGIAEQCLLAGADRVSIGDGAQEMSWDWRTIGFFENNRVFGTNNLKEAIGKLKTRYPNQEIELLCLNAVDEWENIPSSSEDEIMQQGLKVARSFYEADHVISVPVLKTHLLADFSFSMKNLVGVTPIVPPYGPGVFLRHATHLAYANATCGGIQNAGIAGCFTDILKWRKEAGREDYAVIDCSIGMEGNGPTTIMNLGKPIDVKERSPSGKYFLLASKDFVAADATAGKVMNQDVRTKKQLLMAHNLGLGERDKISIEGDATLKQLRIDDYIAADQFQPEWGASETVPFSVRGSASAAQSRLVNIVLGSCLSGGAVYMLKRFST